MNQVIDEDWPIFQIFTLTLFRIFIQDFSFLHTYKSVCSGSFSHHAENVQIRTVFLFVVCMSYLGFLQALSWPVQYPHDSRLDLISSPLTRSITCPTQVESKSTFLCAILQFTIRLYTMLYSLYNLPIAFPFLFTIDCSMYNDK